MIDVKMTAEDSFLSRGMMIKGRNIIMRERTWINLVAQRDVTNAQNLSYSFKVNEITALTTSESVSRYTGYKRNNVWSGLKHSLWDS